MRGLLILAVLAMATATFSAIAAEKAGTHGRTNAADRRAMPAPQERVDINRASVAELLKVPGMTPSWAERIVRFRPYHSKSDLLERGVLPSDVYDRIKNYVIAHRIKKRE
ncbi:MAG: ComEA family DNA-binding protein [Terracidiphilus sp.]